MAWMSHWIQIKLEYIRLTNSVSANTLFNKSKILQLIIRFLKISANELLQKLMRLLRYKQSSPIRDENKYLHWGYKITPFLKLLVTPCLRTLDLKLIENGSYISDVLRLATIKSPVKEEKRF